MRHGGGDISGGYVVAPVLYVQKAQGGLSATYIQVQLPPVSEISPVLACLAGYDWIMSAQVPKKLLLSIIELGGYPNFTPLYESLGYEVVVATRMRKALGFLKKRKPDVIVAEFNFQSDFRDRTSSLESLLAAVQRFPEVRVIVFYEQEFTMQFDKLRARLPVYKALTFPVDAPMLQACLQAPVINGAG